ncbi:uncharacterized protein LOC142325334 [Lycorma delicatula]|uniref:uncharacterized protein LOC142325334 n=1 Tax=Lycorma delicatula TaxID=130591 RepID=UPI003F50F48F
MQLSIFIFTLATTILLIAAYPSSNEVGTRCPCQGSEDCNENLVCAYEEDRDECGRKICLMGPDQQCGRKKGKCSKGLFCSNCGFCSGCSFITRKCATLQCIYKDDLPVY